MTKFEDQLFADLMTEHRTRLAGIGPGPARRIQPRVAWLTGAATTVAAGAATAAVVLIGGSSPAYAVTQNPNGTVTLSVASKAGIGPANTQLHVLGDPVVVVPVGADCPSINSLPKPQLVPGGHISGSTSATGSRSGGPTSITIDIQGVPAGDTAIVAYSTLPGGQATFASAVISGPVPSCVSLPAPPAQPGPGSGPTSGSSSGASTTSPGPGSGANR